MHRRLIGLTVAMALCFWCGSAMAYDSAGCSYFQQEYWGANVNCLGYLELSDMGEFDAEGNWQWNAQFASMETLDHNGLPVDVAFHNTWLPSLAALTPVKGATEILGFRLDNRRKPGGIHDSRISFSGIKNTAMIPNIVALQVDEPGLDCTPDNDWHFQECPTSQHCLDNPEDYRCGPVYGGPYPKIIYQFEEDCSDEDGTCTGMNGQNPNVMRPSGEPLTPSDVASVEWGEGSEITTDFAYEIETYWPMGYDTYSNISVTASWANGPQKSQHPTLFAKPFSVAAGMGINTYNINLTNGEKFNITQEVVSDTVMPTVAADYTYSVTRVNKSGKVINTGQTVTAPNLTAREITADDGRTRLLIQWAEPDRAMELVSNGNVRLRIWVGQGWFNDQVNNDIPSTSNFLWMDVPLHAGSVVVPADAYEWAKSFVTNGELPIAGMYREQFNGFHNRGYFEGIKFPIQ